MYLRSFLILFSSLIFFCVKGFSQCNSFAFSDYTGGKVYMMNNGKLVWEHEAPESNDLWVLPSGNILFTTGKGVLEMTQQNDTVFHYSSGSSVFACQRLKNGNTFVAESDSGRLLEIAPDGKIVKTLCILPQGVANAGYAFMRNARKLDNDHYLVAHYKDQCVKEYDSKGKVVWQVETPGGAHSVIRLPDGHTLVAVADAQFPDGSKNPRIVEFDKKGNIVWMFSNKDIPDKPLRFMTGFQYFSDGRLLLTNWSGHEKSPENETHLLLINKQKEILCRIDAIGGIKTMSSVYSLEKQKQGIKVYH
ncbi:MAG: aryl-sulfate sulfotransferase [Candidatus Azobacteroides sp.]|nr:aryl-sulfate sulfotransferase [Candidatus Azobacteroides sp.]